MSEEELRELLAQSVLYRDALMLIIDKPAGVPVHKGPSSAAWKDGPALESAFDALTYGLPRPPALAHRLDRDTSGCLVLGRHRKALERLADLFKRGEVDKTYWAVVEGVPAGDKGTIDLPLGRKDATRGWWMKPDPAGLTAITHWRVLGRSTVSSLPLAGRAGVGSETQSDAFDNTFHNEAAARAPFSPSPTLSPSPTKGEGSIALLELKPVTGRTHQLRVHCAAMGWPILGDTIYGTAPRQGGPGLHLHARAITVPLYPKKEPIAVAAPPPAHMRERLAACGVFDSGTD